MGTTCGNGATAGEVTARTQLWAASPAQRCTRTCACALPEHCAALDTPGRAMEVRRRVGIGLTATEDRPSSAALAS